MPATITHAFFAKDAYDILPSNITEKLNLDKVKMFGQSTDSLMFYNLFNIKRGKNIRHFQHYFHSHNTGDFFINLLNYIKRYNINNTEVYSFLVGFICHYALDSTVHPYIMYNTGAFKKGYPETYKYNNIHAFMEVFLDNDMVMRRLNCNPYNFDIGKFCFDIEPFSEDLNKTIDYTFYKTFKIRGMSKIYYTSLKQMKMALEVFRSDPYGYKKFFYKLIDTFTPKSVFRFEAISYHYPLEDTHNFLNNNHELWRHPCIYDMTSTESFIDLYLKALNMAKDLINSSFSYLNGKDVDLESKFKNISYHTGLECEDKKELIYFKF